MLVRSAWLIFTAKFIAYLEANVHISFSHQTYIKYSAIIICMTSSQQHIPTHKSTISGGNLLYGNLGNINRLPVSKLDTQVTGCAVKTYPWNKRAKTESVKWHMKERSKVQTMLISKVSDYQSL